MKCVVCKVSYVKGQGRAGWVNTSDRTPFEKTQLIFKLFDLLKTEFAAGSVCTACYELLAQIDSLQFQVRQIVRALRTRIDCCSTEKDYLKTHTKEVSNESFLDDNYDEVELDDDDEEEKLEGDVENIAAGGEECSGSQSRRRKRRRGHARRGRSSSPIADAANASEHEVEMEKAEESVGINKKSGMPNLSTDNLDFAITVTTTTRGHEQLLYENYTYLRTTHQPQGVDLVRWKCSNYYATKTGCPAKLNTGLGGSCVLRDTRVGHNHSPPGESQLKIILFREQVRQIVSNHPDMKPAEILASARMLQDAAPPGSLLGLKEESIMRYIQRVKSKNRQQRQQQRRHEDLQIQQQQQQDEEQIDRSSLEQDLVNLLPGLQQDQQDIRDPTRVEEAGTAAVQQEAVSAGGAVSNPRQQQQQLPQEALAREIEDLNSRRDKVGEESEEDSNQDMLEQILM